MFGYLVVSQPAIKLQNDDARLLRIRRLQSFQGLVDEQDLLVRRCTRQIQLIVCPAVPALRRASSGFFAARNPPAHAASLPRRHAFLRLNAEDILMLKNRITQSPRRVPSSPPPAKRASAPVDVRDLADVAVVA
jgi:hypothetical protein